MIVGYSAQQLRDAEAPHLAAGEPLMQRAAVALAREIDALLPEPSADAGAEPARILVLVGSGNNGGDALFAAATLADSGCDVAIISVGSRVHEAGLQAALAAGARREDAQSGADAARLAATSAVIVDAILGTGTGANPALRGRAREFVSAILPVVAVVDGPIVVAVDIPSGIGPDDGSVPDLTVLPADVTVTFGGYKAGLLLEPAARLAGEVHLVDIGLADDLARMEPLVRHTRGRG
ncbi:MAG: NAD(P)H-hydrate epimerase [Microbacteriaceae bacterium]